MADAMKKLTLGGMEFSYAAMTLRQSKRVQPLALKVRDENNRLDIDVLAEMFVAVFDKWNPSVTVETVLDLAVIPDQVMGAISSVMEESGYLKKKVDAEPGEAPALAVEAKQ
jgi:hypothetical protein